MFTLRGAEWPSQKAAYCTIGDSDDSDSDGQADLVAREFPASHPTITWCCCHKRNQLPCPGHAAIVMIISLGAVVGVHSEQIAIISRMGPAMGGPCEGHMLQTWANLAPVHPSRLHEDRTGDISERSRLKRRHRRVLESDGGPFWYVR
jgi:hypothetical protein